MSKRKGYMSGRIVFVNEFTNGILDPKASMLGPL